MSEKGVQYKYLFSKRVTGHVPFSKVLWRVLVGTSSSASSCMGAVGVSSVARSEAGSRLSFFEEDRPPPRSPRMIHSGLEVHM